MKAIVKMKGEVLVEIKAAAICGSDIKIYKWDSFAQSIIHSLPFIPGHECAGEVVEVGEGVKSIRLGDKVASETHIPCGQCWQCTHGRPHTCENMKLFGHNINGCFAEYAVIPEVSTRKIPSSLTFEEGCMLEPMGIPEKGKVEKEAVVVVGCGPIGQFAIGFSHVMGAGQIIAGCGPIGQFAIGFSHVMGAGQIIAVDVNEERLKIAEAMGAHYLLNPEKEKVKERIKELTKDWGA